MVYTRRDLIPSNEENYMMNFHIVNHVEKNQEENSHGKKDESRGKKKKNNNKSGRGRECESASTSTSTGTSTSASASTKINKNKNINENESTSEGIKVIASLTTKEKVRDKLLVHSQNTDTTDTESDANSDIVFDMEIDSEIYSQLNTISEINSVPRIISELDTNMINNEDSVTSPNSNSNMVMHPKVIADLNSASDPEGIPELENTNNPQLMEMKLKGKKKTIEVAPLTMVLRSRSKLLH